MGETLYPWLKNTNMSVTYILFSKSKNRFYVGSSRKDEITIRIKAHNSGKVRSTKTGRPWVEIAKEAFGSYTEARKREIFLKSGVGCNWVKKQFGFLKQS